MIVPYCKSLAEEENEMSNKHNVKKRTIYCMIRSYKGNLPQAIMMVCLG